MDLLSPEPGLVIWTGLTFIVLLLVLGKFAWNPMLGAIKEREDKIERALKAAEDAAQEYKKIEEAKSKMEAESRLEREQILKEARAMKDSIVEEARQSAQTEADKVIANARAQIEKEKADAIGEMAYSNEDDNVFGTFYEIKGDAASNVQFYLTDSAKNFVRGALYFDVVPNKDSLAPVLSFISEDVKHLIETFKWEKCR